MGVSTSPGAQAQDLVPGEIVSVGQNTYRLRITGKLIGVADRQAKKRARDYCTQMSRTMLVKGITFDMGYGYTLTWTCLPGHRR